VLVLVSWPVRACGLLYTRFSEETFTSICRSTWRYNAEYQHKHAHRRENHWSRKMNSLFLM
jgi:hypothetical protein